MMVERQRGNCALRLIGLPQSFMVVALFAAALGVCLLTPSAPLKAQTGSSAQQCLRLVPRENGVENLCSTWVSFDYCVLSPVNPHHNTSQTTSEGQPPCETGYLSSSTIKPLGSMYKGKPDNTFTDGSAPWAGKGIFWYECVGMPGKDRHAKVKYVAGKGLVGKCIVYSISGADVPSGVGVAVDAAGVFTHHVTGPALAAARPTGPAARNPASAPAGPNAMTPAKIAECDKLAVDKQRESQTWPGDVASRSARLGDYQKELFLGRCAGHPQAKTYLANADAMLAAGNSAALSAPAATANNSIKSPKIYDTQAQYVAAIQRGEVPLPTGMAIRNGVLVNAPSVAASASPAGGSQRSPSLTPTLAVTADATISATAVSDCLKPVRTSDVGRFENKCGFKVNFAYCNAGKLSGEGKPAFSCGESGAVDSVGANSYQGALISFAKITYFFACRAPLLPQTEYEMGKGIIGQCK